MVTPNSTENPQLAEHRTRILVAEDDDAMRVFLVKTLRRLSYDVQEIGGSDEMVRYLGAERGENRQPDIIISGMRLPGKTLLDTLVAFKERVRQIPVILITTLEDPKTHRLALRLGAAAIFDKPFRIESFTAFLLKMAPPSSGSRRAGGGSPCEPCLDSGESPGSKFA